jgi:pyrrolidone-carboxylate peptidase
MLKAVKKIKLNTIAVAISFSLCASVNSQEINNVELTVEELRIEKALKTLPSFSPLLTARVDKFTSQLNKATSYTVLTQLVIRHGGGLWLDTKKSFRQLDNYDDRPLYWSRLQMSKALRSSKAFGQLFPSQQQKLLWMFELLSRGQSDVKFDKKADKKILLTGFDPFFLDRHIDQSNPSGVVALSLDDLVVSIDGQTAEIEVLIVPVRFADFDQGMIEELLTPYIQYKSVDMVLTVSMGRENFDLERYPALRRSAKAPDNLNILTEATASNPLVPKFKESALQGPEFVEFSLPIKAMEKGAGKYTVHDNRKVSTISGGSFDGQSLTNLMKETSVSGSGGGYLSNEVSYRSILLRNKYNSTLPVGHIHTPKITSFNKQALVDIVNQTKNIITEGVAAL